MLETFAVALIVAAAGVWSVLRIRRAASGGGGCGCASCGKRGCSRFSGEGDGCNDR